MDIFSQLTCLESKGVITDSQMQALTIAAASMPNSQTDILRLIAASMISSSGQNDLFSGSPLGVESITCPDTTTVMALISIPEGATRAIVSVHGNNIIFRIDGSNPAVNVGHYGELGSNFLIGSLADFKAISQSSTDAVLFISYY